MYRLATKLTAKTTKRKREREFFSDMGLHVRPRVYWFRLAHYLLLRNRVNSRCARTLVVTLEWVLRVHIQRPVRSDSPVLVVRWPKLVTKTGFIVRQ